MNRFNNDYNMIACDEILNALNDYKNLNFPGYSADAIYNEASDLIKKSLGRNDVDIHFLVGGTQTNTTVIKSILRPIDSVIAASTGHINVHETGAIESTGHKIEIIRSDDGKINNDDLKEFINKFENIESKEHVTNPKMVYISFPTELGTLYSKKELKDIYETCKAHKLILYIDGARLAYGLTSKENDVKISDLPNLCDAFYIGGTKCGAMFGEAVILVNNELKSDFKLYIKQGGGLLAKGFLLGIQFKVLFTNNLYIELNKKAVEYAMKIREAFIKHGVKLVTNSFTNQQFVFLTDRQMEYLSKNNIFEFENKVFKDGIPYNIVRFCTSWSTSEKSVNELINDIDKINE